MSLRLDRRQLIQLGTLGAAALFLPGAASALAARGFTHGVASGEPAQHSVLLWTRFVAPRDTLLDVELSDSPAFDRPIAAGQAVATPGRDHTARLVATGLQPGRWYYYRFRAPGGAQSPVGRTRTLPDGPIARFGIGVFSCSNLPFGCFNAYAHAASRGDLDLVVHLGDYLYEYERGQYPTLDQALPGRIIDPADEMVELADYRLRHAAYRADPDLRRLHQYFPMVAMWDDHEITNDAWRDGAENHQPASEGDWNTRKAVALRVYREWMPVSDQSYTEYRIGDLATLFRPETRVEGRVKQLDLGAVLKGQADPRAALTAFRDGAWADPSRTLLGAVQERRLGEGLRQSVSAGVRWQVLAQQVVMGSVALPSQAATWIDPKSDARARTASRIGLLASSLGLPFNYDGWDGYPAARARLLRSAQEAKANLVVLSGDSHNAWAFDHAHGGAPAGVEFAVHSVTSPGYEGYIKGAPPRDVERAVMARNPTLKWANFERRGYLAVELTPARATGEWLFLDTIRQRSTAIASTNRLAVDYGQNRLG